MALRVAGSSSCSGATTRHRRLCGGGKSFKAGQGQEVNMKMGLIGLAAALGGQLLTCRMELAKQVLPRLQRPTHPCTQRANESAAWRVMWRAMLQQRHLGQAARGMPARTSTDMMGARAPLPPPLRAPICSTASCRAPTCPAAATSPDLSSAARIRLFSECRVGAVMRHARLRSPTGELSA